MALMLPTVFWILEEYRNLHAVRPTSPALGLHPFADMSEPDIASLHPITDMSETHLSRYLPALEHGETILLCKRNVPIAEIRPLPKTPDQPRPFGLAADYGGRAARGILRTPA